MKIILSRKGFDSGYGGCASPILPDGKTMLSMPIPSYDGYDELIYKKILYNGITYAKYWSELCPERKDLRFFEDMHCHLDPDIRRGIRENDKDYPGAFGQDNAAQGHLHNKGVTVGDIFLFFGWFRRTEQSGTTIKYKSKSNGGEDLHVIFGYLQIGEIIQGEKLKEYTWHPHHRYSTRENTLYIAPDKLTVNGEKTELPGYGTFDFDDELVLTKQGYSRSKWKPPMCLLNAVISYHSEKSRKGDYFQSANIGQEFVIEENDAVTAWALKLIRDHVSS